MRLFISEKVFGAYLCFTFGPMMCVSFGHGGFADFVLCDLYACSIMRAACICLSFCPEYAMTGMLKRLRV